ncbi:MAG: hypothetical protein LBH43_04990 [Treponema sp.]|jgi:hypothetical protein|nr:hypothetical protein [Treponema sp.]
MDVICDADGKAEGSLQMHENDETRDVFTLTPRLDFGLQYKIIPDKLVMNAGGRMARGLSYTAAAFKVYDKGNEDITKASKSKNKGFGTMN